jgi:hypothetical protein
MPNHKREPSTPEAEDPPRPERDDDETEKPHDEDDRARLSRRGTGPERPYQGGRSGNQKR